MQKTKDKLKRFENYTPNTVNISSEKKAVTDKLKQAFEGTKTATDDILEKSSSITIYPAGYRTQQIIKYALRYGGIALGIILAIVITVVVVKAVKKKQITTATSPQLVQSTIQPQEESYPTQQTTPRFCTYCGGELIEGKKFCSDCGAQVDK